jgi:hypothetical protein
MKLVSQILFYIIISIVGIPLLFILTVCLLTMCNSWRSISPPREMEHATVVEEPTKVAYVVSEQPSASAPRVVESSEDPV